MLRRSAASLALFAVIALLGGCEGGDEIDLRAGDEPAEAEALGACDAGVCDAPSTCIEAAQAADVCAPPADVCAPPCASDGWCGYLQPWPSPYGADLGCSAGVCVIVCADDVDCPWSMICAEKICAWAHRVEVPPWPMRARPI